MIKHRTIILTSLFISFNLLLGCQKDEAEQTPAAETTSSQVAASQATAPLTVTPAEKAAAITAGHTANMTTGTVIESIDASGYTYVQVDNNGESLWMAGPKTTIAPGASIQLDTRAPMPNFHSKALNRDFPVIYFVDSFSGNAVQSVTGAPTAAATNLPPGHAPVAAMQTSGSNIVTLTQPVERAENGHTIAEVIANKTELASKVVKVRGKVTKFTGGIMGKNWIHMIDGSGDNDLIVITDQLASTEQMIVIEGTVALDQDFGYGYAYELLVDNAKITVE